MTRINKLLAVILALMIVITAGVISVSAAVASEDEQVAAEPASITIHVSQEGLAQPYIYLWNSLPTNSAMSQSYPGEIMTRSGDWFNYTVPNVTKVNVLITDAQGKQYSGEKMLTSASTDWYYLDGRWSKYDPTQLDPVESLDMREDSIYFVMTTRFYDGDSGNNVHCWDDSHANNPDSDPAWRGDFKGLAEKLDYIKALGFNAIWVTPVVTNASGYDYHGYHAFDFANVDPRYESSDFDFDDLVRAVHAKGMKIIQDIVIQHTGNFGEDHFCKLFEKDYSKDLGNIEECMVPTQTLMDALNLSSPQEYWNLRPQTQYDTRLNLMKNTTYSSSQQSSTGSMPSTEDYGEDKISSSSVYNSNNYYHTGYFQSLNWDDWSCKFCQIAGDCVDLNTENTAVMEYMTDVYSDYINRGVDGFRVDTVRHIPRVVLNILFNDQIYGAAAARGNTGFHMFGEICTRYTDVWYRGHAEESTPYYTWKESNPQWAQNWSWGSTAQDVNSNMNLVFDHYLAEDSVNDEPTSNNAFLSGITYHTPDRSRASGMEGIDFQMHRMFGNAGSAFGIAKSGDKYYNDATYNVMYVDSHDYAPEGYDEKVRFAGGTQVWAENLDLMFTFRGIPCIYYGSEVEFQKGQPIDVGPNAPLSTTGRAYFGDWLEGNVDATDFSEYTASGAVAETLDYPLAKHIRQLNAIRRAVPALQKGQYTVDSTYVSGNMAFIRRYTDSETDSLALVTISGGATFNNIPNGRYVDAVTGEIQNVSNGTLSVSSLGTANMRVFVLSSGNFTGISGKIGETGTYLN